MLHRFYYFPKARLPARLVQGVNLPLALALGLTMLPVLPVVAMGDSHPPSAVRPATGIRAADSELSQVEKLIAEGSLMTARPRLERLLMQYPADGRVALTAARLYQDMGLSALAIIQYERVRQLQPHLVEPLVALSRLHLENLSSALALSLAEDAAHMAPADKEARLALVEALLANQYLRRAREQMESLLSLYPNDGNILHAGSMVLQACGENEKALQLLEAATRRAPARLSWQTELANLLQVQGAFREARNTLQSVIEADPFNLEALTALAHLYEFDLGQYLEAREVYRRILQFLPDDTGSQAGVERCTAKQADLALWFRGILYRALGISAGEKARN